MKTTIKTLAVLFLTISFVSCSNDDNTPAPVNEEEVITTMTAEFVPQGGGTTVTLKNARP